MNWLAEADEWKQRGEIGRAIEVLEQAIAIGDESADIYKEAARLCLQVNEMRAFSNYCHEAMRIEPGDPEPQLMLSWVLCVNKRWSEAVEALEQVLRMPSLDGGQRSESERLLETARFELHEWRTANPGHSNL